MERCSKCSAKRRDGSLYSPLGQPVCGTCYATISGAATGAMTGGLGGAIAGGYVQNGRPAGLLAWIRRALGKDVS